MHLTPASYTCDASYTCGAPQVCEEPDECAAWSGLSNNCHVNASCAKVPGSYLCSCNDGYTGNGTHCEPVCGDGRVVPGEACDDGNTLDSDGCSASCSVEQGFSCHAPAAPDLPSSCRCDLDGEVCCARAYVKCLLAAARFTPANHGIHPAGIGVDGCPVPLVDQSFTHHLASAGESCHEACAALPLPGSLERGQFECVAHGTREALLDHLHTVSLPAALGSTQGAGGAGAGAGGWACARIVTEESNTGVAAQLPPAALPMVDEFAVSGLRAVGDGLPSRDLVCYVRAPGLPQLTPTVAGDESAGGGPGGSGGAGSTEEWCRTRPTVATGRRLCQCRRRADVCSNDCLAAQVACNSKVAARSQRVHASYEPHNPCLDDPHYAGSFVDANNFSTVNVSFDSCEDVGAFIRNTLPELSRNLTREARAARAEWEERVRGSNGTLALNASNLTWDNSSLQERFMSWSRQGGGSCSCNACPVTCGRCDRCYTLGGTYFYGGVDRPHPARLQHPSRLHGVAAPVMVSTPQPGTLIPHPSSLIPHPSSLIHPSTSRASTT